MVDINGWYKQGCYISSGLKCVIYHYSNSHESRPEKLGYYIIVCSVILKLHFFFLHTADCPVDLRLPSSIKRVDVHTTD